MINLIGEIIYIINIILSCKHYASATKRYLEAASTLSREPTSLPTRSHGDKLHKAPVYEIQGDSLEPCRNKRETPMSYPTTSSP